MNARKTAVVLAVSGVVMVVVIVAAALFAHRTVPTPPAPPVREEAAAPLSPETAPSAPAPPVEEASEEATEEPPVAVVRVYGTVIDGTNNVPVVAARLSPSKTSFEEGRARDRGRWRGFETEDSSELETHTDETGAYSFELSSEGWRSVVCTANGYAQAYQPLSESLDKAVRLDFILQPGSAIMGRVTNAATGEGIAGVTVEAAGSQQNLLDMIRSRRYGGTSQAVTKADGTYALEGLALQSYRVFVRARSKGYLFHSEDVKTVDLQKGVVCQGVDFALELGAVVAGTVHDSAGQPIVNARVFSMPGQMFETAMKGLDLTMDEGVLQLRGESDAAGRFSIAGLDYEEDYRLRADAEGYAEAVSDLFRIKRGESPKEISLVLLAGSRISGVARFADGAPAGKQMLRLFPNLGALISGRSPAPQSTSTQADGSFSFEEVSPGEYAIYSARVHPFSAFGGPTAAATVEVDGITDIEGIEVILEKPRSTAAGLVQGDGVIEGIVLDPSGHPAGEVRVDAKQSANPLITTGGKTRADGTFRLTDLARVLHDLTVTCESGAGEARDVAPGSKITIRLMSPSLVSGVVVDWENKPVASCAVSLVKLEDGARLNPAALVARSLLGDRVFGKATDASGYFEFKHVTAGNYVVKARSPRKGTGESAPFRVVAGGKTANLRVRLYPGQTFAGTVDNTDGEPVSGAMVQLVQSTENALENFVTTFLPPAMQHTVGSDVSDTAGTFRITDVPPGAYTVIATHSAYAKFQAAGITVTPGRDTADYRIVLGKGGGAAVEYHVDGQARAGVLVQFMGRTGIHMATTDENGRLELGGLAPGEYLVNVVDPEQMSPEQGFMGPFTTPRVIDIADGETAHLELGPGEGVAVEGVVGGQLDPLAMVVLRRPGGPSPETINPLDIGQLIDSTRYVAGQTLIAPGGTFRLSGIEPGHYFLEVYSIRIDPNNPDWESLLSMNRAPRIRQEVHVGNDPLHLNLNIP